MAKQKGLVVSYGVRTTTKGRLAKAFVSRNQTDLTKIFSIKTKDLMPIRDHMKAYWKVWIYYIFNTREGMGKENSGQLGRSLFTKITGNRMSFHMKPIYKTNIKDFTDERRSKAYAGGDERQGFRVKDIVDVDTRDASFTKTTWEYGRFLRKGTQYSPNGTYSPWADKKLPGGKGTQGISPKYWRDWMKMFKKELNDTTIKELTKTLQEKDRYR